MAQTIAEDLKDAPEVEDDFFEKILKEDIEIPKDDDVAPTPENKVEDKVDVKESKQEETVESLKAKIAEMEKERKGQLSDVVKSRQEKQLFKSELNQLKEAVALLLEKRANADNDVEEKKEPDPLSNPRTKVEFDDDKAYVDLSEVKKAITAETAKTKAELDELKQQRAIEEAQRAYVKNVKSIIGENEEVYGKAYENLKEIYKAFNDKIIELQQRTGEMGDGGVLTQDYALELFTGSPEEQDWIKEHPGIDPTRVARAFNTRTDLRVGLKHLAKALNIGASDNKEPQGVLDKKIQEAKNKPGSLAGQENRAGATGDLISKLASMSSSDFESLSNAEVAKIEAMLLKEELQGE